MSEPATESKACDRGAEDQGPKRHHSARQAQNDQAECGEPHARRHGRAHLGLTLVPDAPPVEAQRFEARCQRARIDAEQLCRPTAAGHAEP